MVRQSTSKGAPPAAYVITNTVIWVAYVTLVILVVQVLAFADPVAVAVAVLVAALVFRPLRRRATQQARRHFGRR